MTPLQVACNVFNTMWDGSLLDVPASTRCVCIGFEYPSKEDGRPPWPFELALEWDVSSGELIFSSAIEGPYLPRLGKDEMAIFFSQLGALLVPFIALYVPDEGLSAAVLPVLYDGFIVAGYRSRIACSGGTRIVHNRMYSHLDCSSRMLYWSKPIFDEMAATGAFPTKRRCLEHLHRSVELEKFHANSAKESLEEPEERVLFASLPN